MLTLVATSSGSFVPTAVTISGAKLLNIRHLTKSFRPYFFRLLKFQKLFTNTSHTPTPPSTQTHNLHSTRIPLIPLRRKSQKTPEIICMNKKNIITLHRKSRGKMPERSIGTVSKTVVPLRVPRVRIPVFPQPYPTKIGLKATNRRLSNSSAVFSCLFPSTQDRCQT